MDKYLIKRVVVGVVSTNCYILKNERNNEALIIDPGASPESIVKEISDIGAKPIGILLTHGHFDHILGVSAIKEKYNIPVYASIDEKETLNNVDINLTLRVRKPIEMDADVYLNDKEVAKVGDFTFEVLHTPGHTMGSCCYYFKEHKIMFSGDMLFLGTVGRTDLPGGSYKEIINSLKYIFDIVPDDVEVFPGHDDSTTIQYEKRYNEFANL